MKALPQAGPFHCRELERVSAGCGNQFGLYGFVHLFGSRAARGHAGRLTYKFGDAIVVGLENESMDVQAEVIRRGAAVDLNAVEVIRRL